MITGAVEDAKANSHAVYWPNSSSPAVTLPAPSGAPSSNGLEINASNQLVGNVFSNDGSYIRAVFWDTPNSVPVVLAVLPGALDNTGLGARDCLNDAGQVVGGAFNYPETLDRAVFWAGSNSPAVDLGTLGGELSHSFAEAINNHSQIVGEAWSDGFAMVRAAFWASSSSAGVELGALSAELNNSAADGINQRGQIVGGAFNNDSSVEHAVLWPDSTSPAIDLNNVIPAGSGWILQHAVVINNAGVIAGHGTIGGHTHGFALVPRPSLYTLTDLGPPANDLSESVARAINDLGQMTGREFNADQSILRALFFSPSGTPSLLNGTATSAYSINNNGQIVGAGGELPPDFINQAVFWENSSSPAMILAGPGDGLNPKAVHINATAQIVGSAFNDDFSFQRAVFWNNPSSTPVARQRRHLTWDLDWDWARQKGS